MEKNPSLKEKPRIIHLSDIDPYRKAPEIISAPDPSALLQKIYLGLLQEGIPIQQARAYCQFTEYYSEEILAAFQQPSIVQSCYPAYAYSRALTTEELAALSKDPIIDNMLTYHGHAHLQGSQLRNKIKLPRYRRSLILENNFQSRLVKSPTRLGYLRMDTAADTLTCGMFSFNLLLDYLCQYVDRAVANDVDIKVRMYTNCTPAYFLLTNLLMQRIKQTLEP